MCMFARLLQSTVATVIGSLFQSPPDGRPACQARIPNPMHRIPVPRYSGSGCKFGGEGCHVDKWDDIVATGSEKQG